MWKQQQQKLSVNLVTHLRIRAILKRSISSTESFKSHLINVESVRRWSMQNEDLAKKVMSVPEPPLFPSTYNDFYDSDNLTDPLIHYLKWRNWRLSPNISKDNYCQENDTLSMKCALLSHALTFPLTLGNQANKFISKRLFAQNSYSHKCKENDHKSKKYTPINDVTIRLCCVGARGEANLPLEFWREFLIFANLSTLRNKHDTDIATSTRSESDKLVNIDWIIDFIGPDVPSKIMKSRSVSLQSYDDENLYLNDHSEISALYTYHRSLTMNYHTGFLHQYVLDLYKKSKVMHNDDDNSNGSTISTDILNHWDGFILFNPGIGHDNLKKSWVPTLNFILKTRKTILTTAHSTLDSQRDLEVWKSIITNNKMQERNSIRLTDIVFKYALNPFASRMAYRDPFPRKDGDIHLVSPNQSVLII